MNSWKYLIVSLILMILACKEQGPETTATVDIQTADSVLKPAINYDSTRWRDILDLDNSILVDIKYASADNFVKQVLYDCPRCMLRPAVAKALVAVHEKLKQQDLGLKMFDCYRPLNVQKKLWEILPDPRYVMRPSKGSMHNRGAAVDLTIVDSNQKELDMGSDFDFFGEIAHHDYTGHSEAIQANRDLLKGLMAAHGFKHIRTEWWHYSYVEKSFPIDSLMWECE